MFLALVSLAASGFLSATLLPGSSEAVFAIFLVHYPKYVVFAVIVASLANGMGSFTSFLLGYFFHKREKLPDKAIFFIKKFGTPMLFFSFIPVVGDFLPLAAGWLRLSPFTSFAYMIIGKFSRYCFVAWVTLEIS